MDAKLLRADTMVEESNWQVLTRGDLSFMFLLASLLALHVVGSIDSGMA